MAAKVAKTAAMATLLNSHSNGGWEWRWLVERDENVLMSCRVADSYTGMKSSIQEALVKDEGVCCCCSFSVAGAVGGGGGLAPALAWSNAAQRRSRTWDRWGLAGIWECCDCCYHVLACVVDPLSTPVDGEAGWRAHGERGVGEKLDHLAGAPPSVKRGGETGQPCCVPHTKYGEWGHRPGSGSRERAWSGSSSHVYCTVHTASVDEMVLQSHLVAPQRLWEHQIFRNSTKLMDSSQLPVTYVQVTLLDHSYPPIWQKKDIQRLVLRKKENLNKMSTRQNAVVSFQKSIHI